MYGESLFVLASDSTQIIRICQVEGDIFAIAVFFFFLEGKQKYEKTNDQMPDRGKKGDG